MSFVARCPTFRAAGHHRVVADLPDPAAHKDFQEWIYYDTQYVRDLSPMLDLWICWRTFRRMVENFVDQF